MAQTGYTPILIYSSSTAAAAPAAGSLTNSTLGSELAINITDGKLFYKDNANAVQVIGWKVVPTSAGGTGLTSYTAGDLVYYASGTTFTKLAIGLAYQALQVNAGGTAPSWQPSASSVLTAQGDLLYASAANTLARLAKNTTATRYLANTGTSNNPDWAQVNLANGVTGTLPTGNGGTGLTSFTANGIVYASSTSAITTGSALTFDGTNFSTTGSATATAFIPSGSSVPTNGMYLPATNTVAFATNSGERTRISSTGNWWVNTNAAVINSNEAIGAVALNSTSPAISGKNSAGATSACVEVWNNATSGNNLFIMFSTETAYTTRGNIDYNRGAGQVRYNATSDATLKNIIGDSDGQRSLEILSTTRIREYAWKDDEQQKPQIGVIAQELYETYKGAVSVGGNVEKTEVDGNVTTEYRPWGVDKTAFTFHLIAGWQAHEKLIKEQQVLINKLQERISVLETK